MDWNEIEYDDAVRVSDKNDGHLIPRPFATRTTVLLAKKFVFVVHQ